MSKCGGWCEDEHFHLTISYRKFVLYLHTCKYTVIYTPIIFLASWWCTPMRYGAQQTHFFIPPAMLLATPVRTNFFVNSSFPLFHYLHSYHSFISRLTLSYPLNINIKELLLWISTYHNNCTHLKISAIQYECII